MPCLDHRGQTPGVHVRVACRCEPREAVGLRMHRTAIVLEDDGRRRGGTAHRTALRSPPQSVQTARGVCESAAGLVTRPGERAHGVSGDCGDIGGGERTGAGPAGAWHRIPAVGWDAVAGRLGAQGGGDAPAVVAWWGEMPGEPRATGASCVDAEEGWGVRVPGAEPWIAVTWTCAEAPEGEDLGAVSLSHVRHREGLLIVSDYGIVKGHANEDPGTTEDHVKGKWAEVLMDWLPATYHVVTKGRMLDLDGVSSRQLDVIVLHPTYPRRLRNFKYYIPEGAAAAFECKTTLRKRDVGSFIETCASVKRMRESSSRSPYDNLHRPIVVGLLAHSVDLGPRTRDGVIDRLWRVLDSTLASRLPTGSPGLTDPAPLEEIACSPPRT